jgi:excinuclease ABC subunit C
MPSLTLNTDFIKMPEQQQTKLKEAVRQLSRRPGVYLMKDRFGQIIYVGKAKDLKKRVSTYFQLSRRDRIAQPKVRAMIPLIHSFETIELNSESEALLLEGRLIKEYKPRYNTDFTDDKRFLLVRVDLTEALPRFRLTRNRTDSKARYFGPFAHATELRQTLAELKRRFGILLQDANPKRLPDGAWMLYDDMRAEINGHANIVTENDYRTRVDQACDCLEGKALEWLQALKEEMHAAASALKFERAADLRDRIEALERTRRRTRKFTRNQIRTIAVETALDELQNALHLPILPQHIECFDISHISGTFCVASMVVFIDGRPQRAAYRRFRIQSFIGNDDFRAMEEVVGRRYRRLAEEGKDFPSLIVIDGGKGQVNAALKSFLILDLPPPPLIGLAKKREMIVFADQRPALQLSEHSSALRLLMQIRDEAHRFANAYSAELREKRLRESLLDGFPGLGTKRKQLLLSHFNGLNELKMASAENIAQVPGIGAKTAAALYDHLHFTSSQQGALEKG